MKHYQDINVNTREELLSLLALVYRDGGHTTEKTGLGPAVGYACNIIVVAHHVVDAAKRLRACRPEDVGACQYMLSGALDEYDRLFDVVEKEAE